MEILTTSLRKQRAIVNLPKNWKAVMIKHQNHQEIAEMQQVRIKRTHQEIAEMQQVRIKIPMK